MELSYNNFSCEFQISLIGDLRRTVPLGTDIFGNIRRLDNALGGLEWQMADRKVQLENAKVQLANAKQDAEKPFPQEEELKTKTARLDELNILLNMDKRENEIVDGERDEDDSAPVRDCADWER